MVKAIGKVTTFPADTIGMIRAKRVSEWSALILVGTIWGLLGWQMAILFAALAWMIRVETKRARVALWPECYHAMRLIMDEHGFEHGEDVPDRPPNVEEVAAQWTAADRARGVD